MNGTKDQTNIIKTLPSGYKPRGGIGYEFFKSMNLHIDDVAQYIAETDDKETYSSLLTRCIRTALKIKSEGISKNDIVCLCTYNHSNSCVPFIASMFLGIKVASLDPSLPIEDVTHLLLQVKPATIFLVPEALNLIENSLERAGITSKLVIFGESDKYEQFLEYLKPSDEEQDFKPVTVRLNETAVIFFSSGTTGLPKGICQSHYALLAQGMNILNYGVVSSVNLCYSSLYWISAAIFLTASILSGTARVVSESFNQHNVWKLIDIYKVSFVFLAPSQAVEMCKAGRPENINTASLHCLLTGGGPFPEKFLILLRDLLPGTYICSAYGQTEVAGMITCFNLNDVKDNLRLHYKPSSCGKPINGIMYKIVDPETELILGPNQQGELRVKTKLAMNGYYNLDSSESFDSDGWLKTGDIAYFDEEQCFYIIDRIKEMLKYKSWHIPPAVVENVLNSHHSIKKAVVIGVPHEEDGDHAMAVVILSDSEDISITEEDVENYVAARVHERHRLRAGVKFVKSVPMTPSGKIKRRILRDMVLAGKI